MEEAPTVKLFDVNLTITVTADRKYLDQQHSQAMRPYGDNPTQTIVRGVVDGIKNEAPALVQAIVDQLGGAKARPR